MKKPIESSQVSDDNDNAGDQLLLVYMYSIYKLIQGIHR